MKRLTFLGLIAILLTIISCKKKENNANPDISTMAFIHTVPDAEAVDLYINNEKFNTARAINKYDFTGYFFVFSGSENIKVTEYQKPSTLYSGTNVNLDLKKDSIYSVFFVDSLKKSSLLSLRDDLSPPPTGKAKIRYVHLSPDFGPADISIKNGSVVFTNKSFKSFSLFMPIDPGTYRFEVHPTSSSTVSAESSDILIESGKIYTIYISGFKEGIGSSALSLKAY